MVQFSEVNKGYQTLAGSTSVVNRLNNGAFTAYADSLAAVEDRSLNRRNFEKTASITPAQDEASRLFDVTDVRLYREPRVLSFIVPENAGTENVIGYWDIYGPAAVDVMPLDESGFVVTSRDGGNLIKVSLTKTGTVLMEQPLSDLDSLFGASVTLAFSGRKITSSVKITVSVVVNGTELIGIQSNSQLFGDYRRLIGTVKMPDRVTSAVVRFRMEGTGGSSLGLSGCSLVLGAQSRVPYTPSLPDLVVPSGIVFLFVGDVCPSGYSQPAEFENRLALVSGSSASVVNYVPNTDMTVDGPDAFTEAGSDEHDHSNLDTAPIDSLGAADTRPHTTDDVIPVTAQAFIHGIPFGAPIIFPTPGQFVNEKSADVLGIAHTHSLQSNMTAVPPSFNVRFCKKI